MTSSYGEFIAVVAAGNPAHEKVYDHELAILTQNAHVLTHQLIRGVEPMIICGTSGGSHDAGLRVWQALAKKPDERKMLFRTTALLDDWFDKEGLDDYLKSEVPQWLQALVLVTSSEATSRLATVNFTNKRGPAMNLNNCVIWAKDNTGNVSMVNRGSITRF